jgi:hypothetical protein
MMRKLRDILNWDVRSKAWAGVTSTGLRTKFENRPDIISHPSNCNQPFLNPGGLSQFHHLI